MPPLAKKHIFPAGVDLEKSEMLQARFQNQFLLPTNPAPGQVFYKSDIGVGAYWDAVNREWRFFGFTQELYEKLLNLPDPEPQGDRIVVPGTLDFDSSTSLSGSGWSVIVGGNKFADFDILLNSVEGIPINYTRRDIVVIDPTGVVSYIPGIEYSEGVIQPQTPTGSLLLAFIDRTVAGDDTIYVTPAQLSNYVSKSDPNLQTIESDFAIAKLSGSKPNISVFGPNGEVQRGAVDQAGVYSTLQGNGGYSRILTILVTPGVFNYDAIIEFSGVSNLSEKGFLWVAFSVDGTGAMVNNKLQTFGKFTLSKYKLVRVENYVYELFTQHDDFNAFFKFRPQFNFGGSSRYQYYHLQPKVDPLPAGDQFSFSEYGSNLFTGNETAAIKNGESPTSLNPFVTVSKLNSYAYVQDAPTDGNYHARRNGAWAAFSPFAVEGTATDGHVVTSVSGVPTWVAPSGGGGGGLWTDGSGFIYRDGKVVIGSNSQSDATTQALEIKFRRPSSQSRQREIAIFNNEGTVLFTWGNLAHPVFHQSGFVIGKSFVIDDEYSFVHKSGRTAAFQGDAFRFENANGEEILAGTHTRTLRFPSATMSIGTSTTVHNQLRHRSGASGSAAIQLLIEDSGGTSNFQVDNIGRAIFRGTLQSGGLGVNMAPLGSGIQIKGTNDGVDAFRLYTQGNLLVGFYRRTLGWVFRGFSTGNDVIVNMQDQTGIERFKVLANGRVFMTTLPTSDPALIGALWNDGGTVKISAG